MTPEQAADQVRGLIFANPNDGTSVAIQALLAGFDSQAKELLTLRSMLALAARDDETGKAELGAAVERARCLSMAEGYAAKCERRDAASPRTIAARDFANAFALALSVCGPALSLPNAAEVERLRSIERAARQFVGLAICSWDDAVANLLATLAGEPSQELQP